LRPFSVSSAPATQCAVQPAAAASRGRLRRYAARPGGPRAFRQRAGQQDPGGLSCPGFLSASAHIAGAGDVASTGGRGRNVPRATAKDRLAADLGGIGRAAAIATAGSTAALRGAGEHSLWHDRDLLD